MEKDSNLNLQDFIRTTQPLLDHINKKFPDGICISDVQDVLGRQYVDLVQEGGGVHGVALAGYTYILEKNKVAFMKMAGTSAGSINTLLLNAVNTAEEAKLLNLKGEYYETRSEKVLEYLSKKDLRDFIDGPPLWRKLILSIFSPAFKKKGFKGWINRYKFPLIMGAVFVLLIMITGFLVVYDERNQNLWEWVYRLSFVGFAVCGAIIFFRVQFVRKLVSLIQRFGINPGNKFEEWLVEILKNNGINSVKDLQNKFEREREVLNPAYRTCGSNHQVNTTATAVAEGLLKDIADDRVIVEQLYGRLCDLYYAYPDWQKPEVRAIWEKVMRAFEIRLAVDKRVTKELVLVSSDITHGLKVEFPGMHKMYWGDDESISPALYVRASMAVPLFFKPLEVHLAGTQKHAILGAWEKMFKVRHNLQKYALFVDGGILSNFPINVFYNSKMPVPRKPTIGIKLEYENELDSRNIKSFSQFGISMLNTMRFFYDRDFALKQDMYRKTVRSIDTGKIHWLNFNLTEREKLELFFRGALAATIFLSKHNSSDQEIQALKSLGKNVPMGDKTFSIYGEGENEFRIEDTILDNISFEWQSYKIERLIDRLSKEDRKGEIKTEASLNTQEAVPAK